MYLALLSLLFQAPAVIPVEITVQQQLSVSRAQTALAVARGNLKAAELAYTQAKERERAAIAELQRLAKEAGKPGCDFDEMQVPVCPPEVQPEPEEKKGDAKK